MFAFNRRIVCCSILNAELWAILNGLQYAWHHGYRRVIIESNCREAFCCVNNINSNVVRMVNGLVVIKEWLLRSWDVNVNHIFRDHTVSTVFFEESPDGIRSLFEHDL
ncbi:hypothetical protein GQ457_01G029300 [Hibiscus cannabinus]